jgi:flagellar biosynthesis protein FlhF
MLVRKFEAETMAAALSQVKETLGAEALILSTRTVGRRGLGVLGKQLIEVTAAIESPATKPSAPRRASEEREPVNPGRIPAAYSQRFDHLEDEQVTLSRQPRSERVEVAGFPIEDEVRELRARLESQNFEQLQAELSELKNLMQQLTRQTLQQPAPQMMPAAAAPPVVSDPVPHVAKANPITGKQADSADLQQLLTGCGIDAEAATTIARFTAPKMSAAQRSEAGECRRFLTSTLASLVQASGPLWQPGQAQKRVSLIGATGVGKTTTIAKLAAEALQSGARVALVTIDTFRIAAVEQLRVYGEIMGLPVEVVMSPQQLQQALGRHQDKDLILIDTAGRSPQDDPRIDELNQFLGSDSGVENCLVLSAPTAERLQRQTLKAFSKLPLTRLIFTKLDESDRCGSMINLSTSSNLPLAYLTNGQRVPEDLLQAAPDLVAGLVMATREEERRLAV